MDLSWIRSICRIFLLEQDFVFLSNFRRNYRKQQFFLSYWLELIILSNEYFYSAFIVFCGRQEMCNSFYWHRMYRNNNDDLKTISVDPIVVVINIFLRILYNLNHFVSRYNSQLIVELCILNVSRSFSQEYLHWILALILNFYTPDICTKHWIENLIKKYETSFDSIHALVNPFCAFYGKW